MVCPLNIQSALLFLQLAADTESQKQGVPEALIDGSRYNYNLIVKDGSYGVHNIKYVKDLINHSIQRLE